MEKIPTGGLITDAFEIICRVSALINEHGRMEEESTEEEGDELDGPFGRVLLVISTFLINFLAESD